MNNRQTFASGGASVVITDADIRFLSSLPTSDDDPVTSSHLTNNYLIANYIEVTASARQVDYFLAPVLGARIGGDGTAPTSGTASAVAVAGNNPVVCKTPPLMICNPNEVDGPGTPFEPVIGEIVQLKSSGNNSSWVPGNFGLLEPPDTGPCPSSGAVGVACNIAHVDGQGCYSGLVETKTGQNMGPVKAAVNVRFDMWQNPGFKNETGNANYPPAANVMKGRYKQGNSYNKYEDDVTPPTLPVGMGMPTHACYSSGTCDDSSLGGTEHERFAPAPTEDEWSNFHDPASPDGSPDTYWEINHPGLDWNTYAPQINTNNDVHPLDGGELITRAEMYKWEINNGFIPAHDFDGDGDDGDDGDPEDIATASDNSGENGRPMEYTGSGTMSLDRRLVVVAVLNCVELDIKGGSGGPFPVEAWAEMFLVKPAEDSSQDDPNCTPGGGQGSCKEAQIYMEMVGLADEGDDEILHDIIQLYR